MRYYTFLLLGTAMILASCQKDEAEPNAVKPTNLKTEIEISNDNPGLVEVSATASNTNYYKMEFFTDEGSEIVDAEDGTASFTYQKSGTYAVITRAYASFEYFIQHLDSVTVDVPEVDPDPVGIPDSGYSTPMSYPGYNLVWNDEFEGTSLSSDWTFELGTGNNGWGNSELQYYREENAEVRDGMLVITAKEENFGGRNYTSSRIITQGAQSFQYGRIDIRAAVPYGQGIWPALWMLGDNFNTVGWPRCGEIDIMEMVGGSPRADGGDNKVFGTIHWDNNGTKADFGGSTTVSDGRLADAFHVYTIIWDANKIEWYFDDNKFHEVDITPAALDEFRNKFFFIFNVAVGGRWPGSPDATTNFPQTMAVDYVRVFQK